MCRGPSPWPWPWSLRSAPEAPQGGSPVILRVSRTHSRPELTGSGTHTPKSGLWARPRWQIPPGPCGRAGDGEGKLPRMHEAEKWPHVLTAQLGGDVHRRPLEGPALRRVWASLLLRPGSGAQARRRSIGQSKPPGNGCPRSTGRGR